MSEANAPGNSGAITGQITINKKIVTAGQTFNVLIWQQIIAKEALLY